jgi:hypothetical protein
MLQDRLAPLDYVKPPYWIGFGECSVLDGKEMERLVEGVKTNFDAKMDRSSTFRTANVMKFVIPGVKITGGKSVLRWYPYQS